MTFLVALLIGILAGLRSMTAPATVAWGAHLGYLRLQRPLAFIGTIPAVVVLTIFAIGELVVDKLPGTPSRTAPVGLIARIVTGGLSGACISLARHESGIVGAIAGALGGVLGCFGGYQLRRRLVSALGIRDLYVALVEDLIAVVGSVILVTRH